MTSSRCVLGKSPGKRGSGHPREPEKGGFFSDAQVASSSRAAALKRSEQAGESSVRSPVASVLLIQPFVDQQTF